MSERLPNLSYYDSTGQDYGFSKPYSEERAKDIDAEVSRLINEQYERAKEILRKYADGHKQLADVLISREVIYTEDVERIFGKRPWTSRTDEIFASRKIEAPKEEPKEEDGKDDEPVIPVDIPPIPKALPSDNQPNSDNKE
jgi:cell division protease FtsH